MHKRVNAQFHVCDSLLFMLCRNDVEERVTVLVRYITDLCTVSGKTLKGTTCNKKLREIKCNLDHYRKYICPVFLRSLTPYNSVRQ